MMKILLLLVICIVVGVTLYFIFFNKPTVSLPGINSNSAAISGQIDLNGLPPVGSTITISARETEKGEYVPFIRKVQAVDLAKWQWDQAKAGVNYDIRAELVVDGVVDSTSQTLTVTAPADGEQLTLNYHQPSPRPNASVTASPAPQLVTISGSVDLNGYIPSGATIKIEGKKIQDQNYTVIVSNLPAKDGQVVSYATAILDQEYNVRGTLFDVNGQVIGRSTLLTVTAPAANEVLVINSKAQPPATPIPTPTTASSSTPNSTPAPSGGTISGNINFNGIAPQNSGIVILQSVAGQNNYQVAVSGIQPANGSQWSWNGAQSGVSYQIIAVLKQTNSNNTQTDVATSQSIITAAPASNEMLTINSSVSLPAPQGTPTISCQTKNSGANNWTTQISYPSQSGANGYWLQLGSTNGGNDVINVTNNAQGSNNQIVTATLNDSVWYYARYAYTYTPNPNSGSGFSSFSGSFQLKCP
jgi:hypothetical protein